MSDRGYPLYALRAFEEFLWGVSEIPGPRHHERIQQYHAWTNVGPSAADEIPWCSSGLNFCMVVSGIRGTGNAMARSWLWWGRAIAEPTRGCVTVLQRGNPSGPSGHVGIFIRDRGDLIELLGANQRDTWGFGSFPKMQLLGYRVPEPEDYFLGG